MTFSTKLPDPHKVSSVHHQINSSANRKSSSAHTAPAEKIFFTLTGTRFYFGHEFMEPGMQVLLEKEPENLHDPEAIQIKMEGLGRVGYVANSVRTVVGESHSAGRLYDKIGSTASGTILYCLPDCVLCTLNPTEE